MYTPSDFLVKKNINSWKKYQNHYVPNMNKLNYISSPHSIKHAFKLIWLALCINLQSSEIISTSALVKPQTIQISQDIKIPFEVINQTIYTTYESLVTDIHNCGLIQTLSRNDYIRQLQQNTTLNLTPETQYLLTHIDSTQYSPKYNQVIRQIMYETLLDQLRNEIKLSHTELQLATIAQVITSQLHLQFDPNHNQISEHMQIQRVDPWVRQSLNRETINAISDHINHEEQHRKQLNIIKGLSQTPKKVPDSDSLDVNEYYNNGIRKYSWNYAADTFAQHSIKLRSTKKWYYEIGNNQSTGRTSLVWINASTVDYIISCKKSIDSKYGNTGIWYFTWWTEWWDHALWEQSHQNWFKWDIRWRWISALLLAVEYGSNQIKNSKKDSNPQLWVQATFIYHGPNHHMDIKVVPLWNEEKSAIASTKNR